MLTCKETSELVSQSFDRRLPLFKRITLKMHLRLCKLCVNYKKQLLLIRKLLRIGTDQMIDQTCSDTPLPEEAKTRIKKALSAESK